MPDDREPEPTPSREPVPAEKRGTLDSEVDSTGRQPLPIHPPDNQEQSGSDRDN